jgi:lipopolysaccharide/colanic/teichoic acid biosynthesis glycosyltransferase
MTRRARLRTAALAVKRTIDIVGAGAGLVLLSPVMAGAAIAVHWEMGQRIIYRQPRPGYSEKPISIRKSRALCIATDKGAGQRAEAERIAPLGAFLWRTSIDEDPEVRNAQRSFMDPWRLRFDLPVQPATCSAGHRTSRSCLRHEPYAGPATAGRTRAR